LGLLSFWLYVAGGFRCPGFRDLLVDFRRFFTTAR